MSKPDILYINNLAPHYREPIWYEMASHSEFNFHFAFDPISKTGIKSIDFTSDQWIPYQDKLSHVKNFTVERRVIFQKGALNILFKKSWDAVLLLGDANIMTNWWIAYWCNLKRIPLLLWGHGLYGNESAMKKWWRLGFLRKADINLVYGQYARQLLVDNDFSDEKVKVVYNSLNYDESKRLREESIDEHFFEKESIFTNLDPVLFFIGRHTAQKKLDLLLEAVKDLRKQGNYFNLLFIGEGPVRVLLESLCIEYQIPTHFTGALYEERKIAKYIANADLCVAPGEVGLTAIHSLSYGTPVCTHNNFEEQMPEVESIQEGITGCFFDFEKENLAEVIKNWFTDISSREEVRKNCHQVIDDHYNPHYQIQVIEEAIKELLN